jgi:hypothetical protein
MTSVKNNSDISTCQCDTKPRDVSCGKMNERQGTCSHTMH